MADKDHVYRVTVEWTGNRGRGTQTYSGYDREHRISAGGKPAIAGSSDPAFHGDATRWNPEDLLLASIAACHKLWYLHLCSAAPDIVIEAGGDVAKAIALHHDAHKYCFIANSVNFPITCEPSVRSA